MVGIKSWIGLLGVLTVGTFGLLAFSAGTDEGEKWAPAPVHAAVVCSASMSDRCRREAVPTAFAEWREPAFHPAGRGSRFEVLLVDHETGSLELALCEVIPSNWGGLVKAKKAEVERRVEAFVSGMPMKPTCTGDSSKTPVRSAFYLAVDADRGEAVRRLVPGSCSPLHAIYLFDISPENQGDSRNLGTASEAFFAWLEAGGFCVGSSFSPIRVGKTSGDAFDLDPITTRGGGLRHRLGRLLARHVQMMTEMTRLETGGSGVLDGILVASEILQNMSDSDTAGLWLIVASDHREFHPPHVDFLKEIPDPEVYLEDWAKQHVRPNLRGISVTACGFTHRTGASKRAASGLVPFWRATYRLLGTTEPVLQHNCASAISRSWEQGAHS